MRTMYDSVTAADIPGGSQLVAGYIDGRYKWSDGDWAWHSGAALVHIAVLPSTDDGQVLDVEQGDADPGQAPGWVQRRRAAGVDPTIYCSVDTYPAVKAAFAAAGVPEPHYWAADWTGHPTCPVWAVACQWANAEQSGGHYDTSLVPGDWPGIDPAPAPVAVPAPARPGTYTVQEGDTLSGIGDRLGAPWQSIYAANRAVIGNDPNMIHPGQVLTIPTGQAAYTVQDGDTLSGIGDRFGVPWQSIYAANHAVIGNDPDMIHPGQVLHIP